MFGVSHIIVDEIHERGMNEDFLLIVVRELLVNRPNLRVILMSATFNAHLFSSYFMDAPMLNIPVGFHQFLTINKCIYHLSTNTFTHLYHKFMQWFILQVLISSI